MPITKNIKEYYKGLNELETTGGLFAERDTERLFANLLGSISKENHYFIRSNSSYTTDSNTQIRFDTAVYTGVGIVYGIHEAKKYDADLNVAIKEKKEAMYPFRNIIFENSKQAVLFQDNDQYNHFIDIRDTKEFTNLLETFFSYTSPEIQEYNASQQEFFKRVPDLIKRIRDFFDKASVHEGYKKNIARFEKLLKETINPNISRFETREIVIQHFLTIDIFSSVFSEFSFEKYNPIAQELEAITRTILSPTLENYFSRSIREYLTVVKRTAVNIHDFGIKKQFLINFYEQFYKAYNPKAADRLGVVYTPEPIVKFMIRNTDELLSRHFGKKLFDENVNIIDPATGTGTFIYHLLEYLFEQKKGKPHQEKIKKKYKKEIHANEVSILPYYIASLCIEKVYHKYTDDYQMFQGIVYQDTLENIFYGGHRYKDLQNKDALFNSISQENSKRQDDQNQKQMTVIIGNPPYNANQQNENENNKNREYLIIDQAIKNTYVKESSAQKTKVYDMYARFIRWASDRIQDSGIIAFVTNNSYIDSRSFDGFRKVVSKEFDFIYVVDCKGDLNQDKADPKHRVFGDRSRNGISILFFIKGSDKAKEQGGIRYIHPFSLYALGEEKLDYLEKTNIKDMIFDKIKPNVKGYWLDAEDSDFDELIPTICKNKTDKTIFKVSSLGVATNRDSWVYDFDAHVLQEKVKYFIHIYNDDVKKWNQSKKNIPISDFVNRNIKHTAETEQHIRKPHELKYSKQSMIQSLYRPFTKKYNYFSNIITHRKYQLPKLFGLNLDKKNICICFSGMASSRSFQVVASKKVISLDFLEKTNSLPLHLYPENNQRQDNITDWSLGQFRSYYENNTITKLAIFHYIYAVLNNTAYTTKYEVQLKRDYPRIPFYKDFHELSKLGGELMSLHINFETVGLTP